MTARSGITAHSRRSKHQATTEWVEWVLSPTKSSKLGSNVSSHELLRGDGCIMAAKPKGVAHDRVHLHLACGVRDVIQVAFGVRDLVVDSGWDSVRLNGLG